MKKRWVDIKAGKIAPPAKRTKKQYMQYVTRKEYGNSMKMARKLVVTISHDNITIREQKRRKTRGYVMGVWSVYRWMIRSAFLEEMKAKRRKKGSK